METLEKAVSDHNLAEFYAIKDEMGFESIWGYYAWKLKQTKGEPMSQERIDSIFTPTH